MCRIQLRLPPFVWQREPPRPFLDLDPAGSVPPNPPTATLAAIDAALVSAAVALVVAVLTSLTTVKLQKERLRLELRTQFMAEEAIVHLLEHPQWTLRSFAQNTESHWWFR
jgi:hypothetical protein